MRSRLLILIGYAVFVMALMVLPGGNTYLRFPYADKFVHAAIFFVFGMLSSWAAPKKHVMVITGSLLFAALTEFVQLFLPYRRLEVLDLAADSVGIMLGWLAYQSIRTAITRPVSEV